MQISTGCRKLNIFKKSKMPRKYLSKHLCFRGFAQKHNVHCAFGDYLSVTHDFVYQIFRVSEAAPLSWAGVKSDSFQPEAVSLAMAYQP
jgi:hypothetical protein